MDPDLCLEEMIKNAKIVIERNSESTEATELSTYVLALYGWLKAGGSLPREWQRDA